MNNRRLFFILVKFNYQKYRSRKYHALVDTGENITVAKYNQNYGKENKKC